MSMRRGRLALFLTEAWTRPAAPVVRGGALGPTAMKTPGETSHKGRIETSRSVANCTRPTRVRGGAVSSSCFSVIHETLRAVVAWSDTASADRAFAMLVHLSQATHAKPREVAARLVRVETEKWHT